MAIVAFQSSMQAQTPSTHLYDSYVLGNYNRAPLTLVRGEGTKVWADDGTAYLDFTSGIAVNTLGHCHPAWVAAVHEQASTLVHTSNLFRNLHQGELAKRLVERAGAGRVFFCNSGAEANEALIKLSRLHGLAKAAGEPERCFRVICAQQAFHGRTFGGMSATPQAKVQDGFRPLVPGFGFARLNDLESFADQIDDSTSAVLIETIQGEGGIHSCTADFLQGLRALCDKHNVLLMLDEVQCGVGRTGRFFAFEHFGVRPDAIGMAKGLGGGFPIGAIWVSQKFEKLFKPGSHGSTFGGTPLASAAALAVIDAIEREDLLEGVRNRGAQWLRALAALAVDFPAQVLEVRGMGFLAGVQMASDSLSYVAALRDKGLLAANAGGNVVRLLPPLTVSSAELDRSLEIFRKVLEEKA